MKKILGILVLGLLWSGNTYANTPVQQFVFEKLYDEYSKCTVYYKFTGRGIERKKDVAELTEKENLFLNEMNNLSKESEKNMFFFAQKLKISNQDVQSNIKKIYTSFLDIAGRDYSKTEILNEKYYHICISAIEDPESRMVHWDVEFQKTKKNKDEDLIGKKLFCEGPDLLFPYGGIEFYEGNKLKLYGVRMHKFEIKEYDWYYLPGPISIEFYTEPNGKGTLLSSLNRKTLKWYEKQCVLLENDESVRTKLKNLLDSIKKKVETENKI